MSLIDEVRLAKRLPDPETARRIRVEAGVSQARLAAEIGVERMTVARWEAGSRRPRGAATARYVDLLEQLSQC